MRQHLSSAPRHRQLVREVPGRIANPVWVDDPAFDIGYHVRRSALPRPAGDAELRELVARIMSRPLDRDRPMWEMYLVEGVTADRVAILSKSHHALVDGGATVDIGQLVLDPLPQGGAEREDEEADGWRPSAAPSPVGLVVDALVEAALRPGQVIDAVRHGVADVRTTVSRVASVAVGVAAAVRAVISPAPVSPLRTRTGAQRLFSTVDTSLADYKEVRAALGGSINDVVLATVAGALRSWLQTRGEPVSPGAIVRAVVPVSVRDDAAADPGDGAEAERRSRADGAGRPADARRDAADRLGGSVTSYFVDLPVGEPSAVMRLHQVGYATQAHKDTGRAVGAGTLVRLAGFSPPTLHALGARVASTLTQRGSHLVVTNVPGPQSTLYLAGARMLQSYPVTPVPPGQAVSIGVTSYDGWVYYGLCADRETMPDVEVLAQCIVDSLDELVQAAR